MSTTAIRNNAKNTILCIGLGLSLFMPSQLRENYAQYKFDFDSSFGLVPPYIAAYEIYVLVLLTPVYIATKFCLRRDLLFVIFVMIQLASILLQKPIYAELNDWLALLIPTSMIYVTWRLASCAIRVKALALSIFFFTVVSILYSYITNGDFVRFNLPGFEITSTGYVIGIGFFLADIFKSKRFKYLYLLTLSVGIILNGSRLAILILFVVYIITLLQKKHLKKVAYMVALFIAVQAIVYVKREVIDIDVNENVAIYEYRISDIDPANIDTELINSGTTLGRIAAMYSGISIIIDNSILPNGSDWATQDELRSRNYPSHTHSGVVQFLAKFGFFSMLFFIALVYKVVVFYKREVVAFSPLLFLCLCFCVDYIYFMPAALSLLFILSSLDGYRCDNAEKA